MSLIERKDTPEHFLFFVSTSLSPHAFPGTEYQETSVGFIFLSNRQSCISELISIKIYANVQR